MNTTLNCIVCEKELKSALPDNERYKETNQPADGTAFHSRGHYGSTVFDPMDGTLAELNVCDECWAAKLRFIKITHKSTDRGFMT